MKEPKTNNYFIVNPGGYALSQFVSNDAAGRNQLRFRKNDAYSFRTIEEAEQFITSIQRRCNRKTQPASLKLQVSMYARGWSK